MYGTKDVIIPITQWKHYMRVIMLFLENLHYILVIIVLFGTRYNNGFMQKFVRTLTSLHTCMLIYDYTMQIWPAIQYSVVCVNFSGMKTGM